MTIFADVALANPTEPLLVVGALLCFVVVPIEAVCFFAFQRRVAGVWLSLGLIALANAVSLGAGFIITATFPAPDRDVPEIMIGVAAFFLSWLIEYSVIQLFRRRLNLARLSLTMGVANAASYLALAAAVAWRS